MSAAHDTEEMGEAAAHIGDPRLAASYFRAALQTAEPVLSEHPTEGEENAAAAGAYSGLGDLAVRQAGVPGQSLFQRRSAWAAARDWYHKSLDVWGRVEQLRGPVHAGLGDGDPAVVRRKLQRCEQALSR